MRTQTLERQTGERLVDDQIDKKLLAGLKEADRNTQISMLVNLCKSGRWDYLRAETKPGVQEAVLEECRRQGITTEQIK
jgi:hypothetical protein